MLALIWLWHMEIRCPTSGTDGEVFVLTMDARELGYWTQMTVALRVFSKRSAGWALNRMTI